MEPKPFSAPWKDSDVILVVVGVEFHAHRLILCLQSPVFNAMLSGSFKEASQKRITLEGKDPEEMRDLLKLLYPLNMFDNPLKNENLLSMLALADEYQANAVMKQCLSEATITPSNVLAILSYARRYDHSISEKCVNFAQKMLTYENLKENIGSPEIDLQQEVRDEIWVGKCKLLEDTLAIAQKHLVACIRKLSQSADQRKVSSKSIGCTLHRVEVGEFRKIRNCEPCLVAFKKTFCDSTIEATRQSVYSPTSPPYRPTSSRYQPYAPRSYASFSGEVPESDTQQPGISESQELLNLLEDMDDLLYPRSK